MPSKTTDSRTPRPVGGSPIGSLGLALAVVMVCAAPARSQFGVRPQPVGKSRPTRLPGGQVQLPGLTRTFDVPSIRYAGYTTSLGARRAGVPSGDPIGGAPILHVGGRIGRTLPAISGQFLDTYDPFARQERLLRDYDLGGSLSRWQQTFVLPNVGQASRREGADGAVEPPAAPLGEGVRMSTHLRERMAAYQRDRTADGWALLKEGDRLRAMAAFRIAEAADRNAQMPRFGQLIAAVTAGHYRQAIATLERIRNYDQRRPPGSPNMLGYEVTLADVLGGDENAVDELLLGIRRRADDAREYPAAQALCAYLLWYRGTEDAALDALGVADRIARNHPGSPWARLGVMMREAQRPPTPPG